jgi:hypothetical protein
LLLVGRAGRIMGLALGRPGGQSFLGPKFQLERDSRTYWGLSRPIVSKTMVKTIVDLYSTSRGPTIRIDAQEISAIETLLNAFDRLSLRFGERIELTSLPDFVFTQRIGGVVLMSVQSAARKKLVRTTETPLPAFEMRHTMEDWEDSRHFLAPLLEGSPCHQYFSSIPPDDAIVEVAIKEPRPRSAQNL